MGNLPIDQARDSRLVFLPRTPPCSSSPASSYVSPKSSFRPSPPATEQPSWRWAPPISPPMTHHDRATDGVPDRPLVNQSREATRMEDYQHQDSQRQQYRQQQQQQQQQLQPKQLGQQLPSLSDLFGPSSTILRRIDSPGMTETLQKPTLAQPVFNNSYGPLHMSPNRSERHWTPSHTFPLRPSFGDSNPPSLPPLISLGIEPGREIPRQTTTTTTTGPASYTKLPGYQVIDRASGPLNSSRYRDDHAFGALSNSGSSNNYSRAQPAMSTSYPDMTTKSYRNVFNVNNNANPHQRRTTSYSSDTATTTTTSNHEAPPSTTPSRTNTDTSSAPETVPLKDGLGPKIWTGSYFLPRFVKTEEVPGEGMCHFYDDGSHCKTIIDGEPVNAVWGVTKAGKPRKRLAIACSTCREKKIKCDPDFPRCVQCEKFGRVCKFKNAPRGGQGTSPSSSYLETTAEDGRKFRDSQTPKPSSEALGSLNNPGSSWSPRLRQSIEEGTPSNKRRRLSHESHSSSAPYRASESPALVPASCEPDGLAKMNAAWLPNPHQQQSMQPLELPRIYEPIPHRPWPTHPDEQQR